MPRIPPPNRKTWRIFPKNPLPLPLLNANKNKQDTLKEMNVVRENLENQTALLRVTVGEADYKEQVEKQLKDYKRKANVPGFRPGMVPMGIINKMYRKGVLADTA